MTAARLASATVRLRSLLLAAVLLSPVAAAQRAPRLQPTTWPPDAVTERDVDVAFRRGDDVVVAIVRKGSASVGQMRVDGITVTIRPVAAPRRERDGTREVEIETWRSLGRALIVELRAVWDNVMGEVSDCAYGEGTVAVTRRGRTTRTPVTAAACPGGYSR